MSDLFEKLAALRTRFPEDVQDIEADERRVSELLRKQEYAQLETTQELLALCRKDILAARLKLAQIRKLTPEEHAELWHIIEARQWFLIMVARDYDAELTQIESELERELAR